MRADVQVVVEEVRAATAAAAAAAGLGLCVFV